MRPVAASLAACPTTSAAPASARTLCPYLTGATRPPVTISGATDPTAGSVVRDLVGNCLITFTMIAAAECSWQVTIR
jgi:hypothetical protein